MDRVHLGPDRLNVLLDILHLGFQNRDALARHSASLTRRYNPVDFQAWEGQVVVFLTVIPTDPSRDNCAMERTIFVGKRPKDFSSKLYRRGKWRAPGQR